MSDKKLKAMANSMPSMMAGAGMLGIRNPLEDLPTVNGGFWGNIFTNNKLHQMKEGQDLRTGIVQGRVDETKAVFEGIETMATAGHRMKMAFKELDQQEIMMDLNRQFVEATVAEKQAMAEQLQTDLRRSKVEAEIYEKKLREEE